MIPDYSTQFPEWVAYYAQLLKEGKISQAEVERLAQMASEAEERVLH